MKSFSSGRGFPYRPVCDQTQQERLPVLFPARPQLGLAHGRFLVPLDGATVLRFLLPPTIHLMHKVLLKIKQDKVRVILIAPTWPRQHWFTMLLGLSVVTPISLPVLPDLISQDQGRMLPPEPQPPPPDSLEAPWLNPGVLACAAQVSHIFLGSRKQGLLELHTSPRGSVFPFGLPGTVSRPYDHLCRLFWSLCYSKVWQYHQLGYTLQQSRHSAPRWIADWFSCTKCPSTSSRA